MIAEITAAVLDHRGPLQGHRFREFVRLSRFRRRNGIFGTERSFPLCCYGILVDRIVARHRPDPSVTEP
jgi:hypothetical protein